MPSDPIADCLQERRRHRAWLEIDRELRAASLSEPMIERAAGDLRAALPACSLAYCRRLARDGVTVAYLIDAQVLAESARMPHERVHGEILANDAERRVGLRYESGPMA